jgi:hypothetical protein
MSAITVTLPSAFADLEPYADWALATEEERYAKRLATPMDDIRAFYDAVFARADDARKHLDSFELTEMPEPEQHLLWLLFSLICVSYAVEVFGVPQVPDSGSAYMRRTGEPETFPV